MVVVLMLSLTLMTETGLLKGNILIIGDDLDNIMIRCLKVVHCKSPYFKLFEYKGKIRRFVANCLKTHFSSWYNKYNGKLKAVGNVRGKKH